MTVLKDVYRSGEESNLGKTGQVRMEIRTVTNPVRNDPVINTATNPTPTGTPTFVTECDDTINYLGNCYRCNKPRHVKRDCLENIQTQTQAQSSYNRGQKREVICFNCKRRDTCPEIAGDPRRTKDVITLRTERR